MYTYKTPLMRARSVSSPMLPTTSPSFSNSPFSPGSRRARRGSTWSSAVGRTLLYLALIGLLVGGLYAVAGAAGLRRRADPAPGAGGLARAQRAEDPHAWGQGQGHPDGHYDHDHHDVLHQDEIHAAQHGEHGEDHDGVHYDHHHHPGDDDAHHEGEEHHEDGDHHYDHHDDGAHHYEHHDDGVHHYEHHDDGAHHYEHHDDGVHHYEHHDEAHHPEEEHHEEEPYVEHHPDPSPAVARSATGRIDLVPAAAAARERERARAEAELRPRRAATDDELGLYDMGFTAADIHGGQYRLNDLHGRVTLVVNVASQCGYTDLNYRALERVHERYHAYGFDILAFPCNDFGGQEPGTNQEIEAFARSKYNTTFAMMGKISGVNSNPIFTWLRAHSQGLPGGAAGDEINWNFNKFLVDKAGHVAKRYPSDATGLELEQDVYAELIRTFPIPQPGDTAAAT